eukprot:Opistho-2@74018
MLGFCAKWAVCMQFPNRLVLQMESRRICAAAWRFSAVHVLVVCSVLSLVVVCASGASAAVTGPCHVPTSAGDTNVFQFCTCTDGFLVSCSYDKFNAGGALSITTLEILFNNNLREIGPGVFDPLTNLESLAFEYEKGLEGDPTPTTLPAGIFDKLINLQSLSLNYCKFMVTLPKNVFTPKLVSLTSLDFGYMSSLKLIRRGDLNLPALTYL